VNATAAPDGDIDDQAREWALSVFGEWLSPERAQALGQWLAADPRHAQAYDQAEQLMLALGGVDALVARPAGNRRQTWRWAAAIALPLAACLAIGVGVAPRPTILESGRATRTLTLGDGSLAILAPGTRLRTAGWPGGRRYVLERGEALFDVRHAGGRPFQVEADQTRVTVLGTRFEVRRAESGEIGVAVARGRVAVRRDAGGPAFDAVLSRGDSVALDAREARRARLADPEAVADWRRGRLSYASARLTDVASDIGRFSSVRVVTSPAVADLRLTASFRTDQARAFLANLPAALPVEVTPRADGALAITPAPSGNKK
jgi:transmembrane sensor